MVLAVKQTKIAKLAVLGGVALALGGCVGADEYAQYTPVDQQYLDLASRAGDQLERISSKSLGGTRFNTAFGGMPNSGSARYNGHATVIVDRVRDGAIQAGDFLAISTGDVHVEFSGDTTVTGNFSNFIGAGPTGAAIVYNGALVLSNGRVGENRPNDFIADVDMRLDAPGTNESYEIHTSVLGDFVGTPIYGVVALSDVSTTAVVDDVVVRDAAFIVAGEAN